MLDKIFEENTQKNTPPGEDTNEDFCEHGGINCKPEEMEGKKIIIGADGVILTDKERKRILEEGQN